MLKLKLNGYIWRVYTVQRNMVAVWWRDGWLNGWERVNEKLIKFISNQTTDGLVTVFQRSLPFIFYAQSRQQSVVCALVYPHFSFDLLCLRCRSIPFTIRKWRMISRCCWLRVSVWRRWCVQTDKHFKTFKIRLNDNKMNENNQEWHTRHTISSVYHLENDWK